MLQLDDFDGSGCGCGGGEVSGAGRGVAHPLHDGGNRRKKENGGAFGESGAVN